MLHQEAEALGAGEEVVLQDRVAASLGELHTQLVLLLSEPGALCKQTQLSEREREREREVQKRNTALDNPILRGQSLFVDVHVHVHVYLSKKS